MRSILFDFGGTLDYPRHWLDRFLIHYRAAGINLTREQLDLGFEHATRTAYRSTRTLADYGLVELVDYLVRLQIGFIGRYGSEELRENLAGAAGGMRLDEVTGWITQSFVAEARQGFAISREVLAALSGRFRMGVVSNFYGNLENILAEANLTRFFGAIADSSRVGISSIGLRAIRAWSGINGRIRPGAPSASVTHGPRRARQSRPRPPHIRRPTIGWSDEACQAPARNRARYGPAD